jgi:dienelactone hydrolase
MIVSAAPIVRTQLVHVTVGMATLSGELRQPEGIVYGVILFSHSSGSDVAKFLNEAKLATLLIDLLTPDEDAVDSHTAHLRFNIELLTERLVAATGWLAQRADTSHLPIGYFGASTGAAAALVAATERSDLVGAVVSRDGRPDLAGPALPLVRAPTLLIAGGNDIEIIETNRAAFGELSCEKRLVIVPGATHLFEEPGPLDEVARLARDWYQGHLARTQGTPLADRILTKVLGSR